VSDAAVIALFGIGIVATAGRHVFGRTWRWPMRR
jgi:hypothetical protein